MNESRKKLSLSGLFAGAHSGLRGLLIDTPRDFLLLARERMKDLPKTNYDLGYRFAGEGKWTDAIFRFKIVLMLDANYPNANYNLGCCYMRAGKAKEARDAFQKALKQSPGNADVIFMLTSLDPAAVPSAQRPTRMPTDMVTGFFAAQADGYDITEANNRYQAGKVIHDLVKPLLKTETPVVLDLGCGSGIAARPWRATATSIHGIDITPAMLELANKATHAERKLFDELMTADITQLPVELAPDSTDLVLIVNVAEFVGDLSAVLSGAARALKAGGVLAITVEPYAQASGFGLVADTSRFGHSNAYVKQVAASAGLTPLAEAPAELYVGVAAQALVFTKGTH